MQALGRQRRFPQIPHRVNVYLLHYRRLTGVFLRQQKIFDPVFAGRQRDRKRPAHGPHAAVQREFADAQRVAQSLDIPEIAVGPEYPQRYRQIEACAFFSQIGRGKIDRHPVKRKKITAVVYGRADTLARFTDGRVRQPDNRHRRSLSGSLGAG